MNKRLLAKLKEERQTLEEYAQETQKRLKKAPEGSLRVATNKKRVMFYQRTEKQGSTGTYLGKDKRELAEALAQKSYDAHLLELIGEEVVLLDKLIAMNEPADHLDEAYQKLSPARQGLVMPYRQDDNTLRVTWPLRVYPHLDPPDPENAIISNRGEKMRSKSEVIIANTLNELGIPYRYEQTLELTRSITMHPDFTVLRLSDRNTFIWEHFGMMDDPDYCTNALKKIQAYEKAGYIQGVNMIVTFESQAAPLDARAAKRLAQELLL